MIAGAAALLFAPRGETRGVPSQAGALRVFATCSIATVLEKIGADFELRTGNTVEVSIVGLKFSDNLNTDVKAWGARTPAAAPAGTKNTVTVKLQGVSAQGVTDSVDSEPDEPAGTNRARFV